MLESLMYPQAVAILGASRKPDKVGHAFVANLIRSGYQGKIVPVNPEAKDVLGIPCFSSLKEYGGKIDLGVIVVPRKSSNKRFRIRLLPVRRSLRSSRRVSRKSAPRARSLRKSWWNFAVHRACAFKVRIASES